MDYLVEKYARMQEGELVRRFNRIKSYDNGEQVLIRRELEKRLVPKRMNMPKSFLVSKGSFR